MASATRSDGLASIITTSAPALLGQQFGGADVGDAAGIDAGLVHRAGDQPSNSPSMQPLRAAQQAVDDRACVGRIGAAKLHWGRLRLFDQRQFAGRAMLAGLAQSQGQVERACGSGERVRVGDGDQIGRQREAGPGERKARDRRRQARPEPGPAWASSMLRCRRAGYPRTLRSGAGAENDRRILRPCVGR